jgi:DUF971 family protein
MSDLPFPTDLKKTPDRQLLIEWSDGLVQTIPFRRLRDHCRCAVCNAERQKKAQNPPAKGSLKILTAAEAKPLDVIKMHPVGNYAYSIHFSDGHSTGIYSFEMLREL